MLKEQYPYINEQGIADSKLVKHYSDENKQIVQMETGYVYDEAIDIYPCKYSYAELELPETENQIEVGVENNGES